MIRAALVVARWTLVRARRGRALWTVLALGLLPLAVAAWQRAESADPALRWDVTAHFALRVFVLVGAATLLAGAVGGEVEAKTYTYVWTRPAPRGALLVGKVLALAPLLAAAAALVVTGAFLTAVGPPSAATLPWLLRALLAATAGALLAGTFAGAAGALFPRHALVFVLGYSLVVEQLLPFVPGLGQLSLLSHLIGVAGLSGAARGASPLSSLGAAALVAGAWLAAGLYRLSRAELERPDG